MAIHYGVERASLDADVVRLIGDELLKATHSIQMSTYLPQWIDVTPAGERALEAARVRHPDWFVDHSVATRNMLREHSRSGGDTTKLTGTYRTLAMRTHAEITILADAYFDAARRASETSGLGPEFFEAAAIGFARLHDVHRYARAVNGVFDARAKEGNVIELVVVVQKLLVHAPHFSRETLAAVSQRLMAPYLALTGEVLPELASSDVFSEVTRRIGAAAAVTGSFYCPQPSDRNAVVRISNRILSIVGRSFTSQDPILFGEAVALLESYIEVLRTSVRIDDGAHEFEQRWGFTAAAELAMHACEVLEYCRFTVSLDDHDRQAAFECVDRVVSLVLRCVAPAFVMTSYEPPIPDDARQSEWIFRVLSVNEASIRAELIEAFTVLERMHSTNASKARPSAATALSPQTERLQQMLAEMQLSLDRVEHTTTSIAVMQMPELYGLVANMLTMVSSNADGLRQVLTQMLSSDALLQGLDRTLESEMTTVRAEITSLTTRIEEDKALAPRQRDEWVTALRDILKLQSAGKVVASLPLIPGILKYEHIAEIGIDWMKWIDRLKIALRKGPAAPS